MPYMFSEHRLSVVKQIPSPPLPREIVDQILSASIDDELYLLPSYKVQLVDAAARAEIQRGRKVFGKFAFVKTGTEDKDNPWSGESRWNVLIDPRKEDLPEVDAYQAADHVVVNTEAFLEMSNGFQNVEASKLRENMHTLEVHVSGNHHLDWVHQRLAFRATIEPGHRLLSDADVKCRLRVSWPRLICYSVENYPKLEELKIVRLSGYDEDWAISSAVKLNETVRRDAARVLLFHDVKKYASENSATETERNFLQQSEDYWFGMMFHDMDS